MKVIIAGGRDIFDLELVHEAVGFAAGQGIHITEVVSGCASGVDTLGEIWAFLRGIPIHRIPAQWAKFGRRAGPIRNRAMAREAQACIVVWNGYSRGTKNMILEARARGLTVYIHPARRPTGVRYENETA